MGVSVEHDGFTITSTSTNADEVRASVQAADTASTAEAPPAASPVPVAGTEPPAPAPPVAPQTPEPVETAEPEPTPAQSRDWQNGQFHSRHKKGSLQWRMDQKTWQANEALRTLESERQERQRLQRELEDARRSTTPPAATKPPDPADKPRLDQFETYEDFVEATADWKAEQKFKARDQQWQQQQFLAERARLGNEFQQRRADFAKTVADFEETVDTTAIELSPVMCEAVVTSAHGPQIAYYLGKHPEEAYRLLQESQQVPVTAAPLMRRELERAALTFLGPSAPPASTPAQATAVIRHAAPAPIKPVGSGLSVADTALDDLPFGPDYVAKANKRDLDREKAKYGR